MLTKWPTNHGKISRLYVAPLRPHSEKMDSRAGAYLVQTLSIKAKTDRERVRGKRRGRILCSAALRNEGGPFSHLIDVLRAAARRLDVY